MCIKLLSIPQKLSAIKNGGGCENLFENLQWRLLFQLADHVRHSWKTPIKIGLAHARIIQQFPYPTII